jgi:hypothetical protein
MESECSAGQSGRRARSEFCLVFFDDKAFIPLGVNFCFSYRCTGSFCVVFDSVDPTRHEYSSRKALAGRGSCDHDLVSGGGSYRYFSAAARGTVGVLGGSAPFSVFGLAHDGHRCIPCRFEPPNHYAHPLRCWLDPGDGWLRAGGVATKRIMLSTKPAGSYTPLHLAILPRHDVFHDSPLRAIGTGQPWEIISIASGRQQHDQPEQEPGHVSQANSP